VRENEVRAEAKYVRVSARKARLVTEHIRGRSVPEARTVLAFTERAVAKEIEKVLHSAVSNAEANHGMIGDELFVSTVYVDEGPTIKRWRARARGRVARIRKRTCHITIKVAPLENLQQAATAPAAEATTTRAPRKRGGAAGTTARKPSTRKKKEATA
jgi:ribosomal protein L22